VKRRVEREQVRTKGEQI